MPTDRSPVENSSNYSTGFFRNPWVVYLLPFAVYLVVGSFEPPPPPAAGEEAAEPWLDLGIRYEHYPWIYGVKILLTLIAIVAVARGYPPRRALHPLAFAGGGTYILVNNLAPDKAVQFKNAPAPNNSNPDTVDYGTP